MSNCSRLVPKQIPHTRSQAGMQMGRTNFILGLLCTLCAVLHLTSGGRPQIIGSFRISWPGGSVEANSPWLRSFNVRLEPGLVTTDCRQFWAEQRKGGGERQQWRNKTNKGNKRTTKADTIETYKLTLKVTCRTKVLEAARNKHCMPHHKNVSLLVAVQILKICFSTNPVNPVLKILNIIKFA